MMSNMREEKKNQNVIIDPVIQYILWSPEL